MIMTNKMEEMYKEAFLAILSCYPGICLQEMGKIEKKLGNDGKYLARVCKETTKCESEEQLKILSPCPEEIIASVRVTNDYLASPCFSKYSWSRIHSRSQMILSNKVTS